MARAKGERLWIRGTLLARTALHVGGLGADAETDLPLARNGAGRLYVPGTALTGAWRAWSTKAFGERCGQLMNAAWGFQDQEGGRASSILVEDAVVTLAEGAAVEIRDGVGIDRRLGAAATGIKYDRAVVPRGSSIAVELWVELPVDAKEACEVKTVIGHLLDALEAGEIRLGAAQTRGLGRCQLMDLTIQSQDLGSRDGVLRLLDPEPAKRGTPVTAAALKGAAQLAPEPVERLTITVKWAPCGPLMVKAGLDGLAVDALPLMSGVGAGKVAPIIPGSSIKGALRSHAERIIRTLRGDYAANDDFLKQVELPLVKWLFGSVGGDDRRLGRGALSVDDCCGQAVALDAWRTIAEAVDVPTLRAGLNTAGLREWQPAMHVAVDRWTGGAADGLLFSVLEPFRVDWEQLRLTIDLGRLPDELRHPAVALAVVLLRDLRAGRIPLGYGGNRGMGAVEVLAIAVQADTKDAELQALPDDIDGALQMLRDSWTDWVDKECANV